jgi:predicted amidohydrolase YtcJ
LENLLQGYALNGAIQLRLADHLGSIEVGKSANLVVLDTDLLEVSREKIQDVEPVAVLFEGRVVQGSLTN